MNGLFDFELLLIIVEVLGALFPPVDGQLDEIFGLGRLPLLLHAAK